VNPSPPQVQGLFASAEARRLFWLCSVLLVLAALALNLGVLDFGFLYLRDDDVNVTLNPHMGGWDLDRLKWMFTDWSYARRYMPLGWMNFVATYEFAGLDPKPYHAVGLALYLANAALVFALVVQVLRFFASQASAPGLRPWDVGAAFLAAGWWTFHPFRVETTAWISGNLYGQAMTLLLASLVAYLGTYRSRGGRRAALLCVSAAAYTGSLLTYPVALGAPVLLIGTDWLYARRGTGVPFVRLLAEKAAFLVPLAAVLAVTVAARFANTEVFGAVPGLKEMPVVHRIAQSSYIAAYYLWKPWWPVNLSPLYDTLVGFNPAGAAFVGAMAAVGAMSLVALARLRRQPLIAVVWFGYLASAAPFFGLTEKRHMPSDRYGYFLTVIVAAAVAALLARIPAGRARVFATLLSLAAVAGLGCMSHRQLRVWSDDGIQHAYVAEHLSKGEFRDDFTSRLLILEFLRGQEKEAREEVARHLAENPHSVGMRNASVIFAEKERVSAFYGHRSYLAIAQDQMGLEFARARQFREANDHFEDALRIDDRFYQAAYDRALVLLHLGRPDDALRSYLQATYWAGPALPAAQRRGFLDGLSHLAEATGKTELARAAKGALAR